MSIKEPLDWSVWHLPETDLKFIQTTFNRAASDIESRCGFRYGLQDEGESLLIGPHGIPEWQFRITKADHDYVLSDSTMTARSRPIYVGSLNEEFSRRLHAEMVERLNTRDKLAYRDAIPGMPLDKAESLAQLEAMAGNIERSVTHVQPAVPMAPPPDNGLQTLRSRKKGGDAPKPDWL